MNITIYWWSDQYSVAVPNELKGFVLPTPPNTRRGIIAFGSPDAVQRVIEDRKALASLPVKDVLAALSDYIWDVTQEAGIFSFAKLNQMIKDEDGQSCLNLFKLACKERDILVGDVSFQTILSSPPQFN